MVENSGPPGILSQLDRAAVQFRTAVSAHPVLSRWLLAGPGVLAAALLFTMSMPVWFPPGAAGVNHIAWPMVVAPLVWGFLFTYVCLEEDLFRGVAVMAGGVGVFGMVSLLAVAGWL